MNRIGPVDTAFLILAAWILAACVAAPPSATPLPTRVYAPEPDANFALYFNYGSCLSESVDTFRGTFTRSMCPPDPPVTVPFALPAEEMQMIYRELASIDFFGYPDQFSVVVPEGAVIGKVTPSDTYYLRVRNGEIEKELYWTDDIFEPTTQEADHLRVVLKKLIDIIHHHSELQQVPMPSGCACA
jgi:hypothetical protein